MNPLKSIADIERYLHESSELSVQEPAWYESLKNGINDLIDQDFDALLQLLYRVDVSENKLRQMLASFPAADAAGIITNLLLERQLQKIRSRKENRPANDSIPDEERW